MATLGSYVFDRLIASTNVTGISSCNVFPYLADYKYVPCIVYSIISQKINKTFKQAVISIKGFEKSQALCETFNGYIFSLFDDSTGRIYELKSDLKIESVSVVNNIPSLWDNENKIWFSVTDIKINYIK